MTEFLISVHRKRDPWRGSPRFAGRSAAIRAAANGDAWLAAIDAKNARGDGSAWREIKDAGHWCATERAAAEHERAAARRAAGQARAVRRGDSARARVQGPGLNTSVARTQSPPQRRSGMIMGMSRPPWGKVMGIGPALASRMQTRTSITVNFFIFLMASK